MTDAMKKMLEKASRPGGCPDNIFGREIFDARKLGWVTDRMGFTLGGNRRYWAMITDAGRDALAAAIDAAASEYDHAYEGRGY